MRSQNWGKCLVWQGDPRVRRVAFVVAALLLGGAIGLVLGIRTPALAPQKQVAQKASTPVSKHVAPPRAIEALPSSATPNAASEEPRLAYREITEPEAAKSVPARAGTEGRERKPVLLGSLSTLALEPFKGPRPLWLQNASAMPDIHGRPMIALVIDDVGLDRKRSERAMHLPGAVTLSFLPYALEVQRQVQQAKALGHEIMMHVPMEPDSPTVDPGPNALRVKDTLPEVQRRLDWDLARFSGYVAVNNHMGSKFTRDPEGMRVVLDTLKARGVFFLDSRTTGASVGSRLAGELGLPHLERDVFLDNVETHEEVSMRLAELERVARRYGYGIAIGHPHDATLDMLEKWTRTVEERGFVLVPISAVMRVRLATEQARLRTQIGGCSQPKAPFWLCVFFFF